MSDQILDAYKCEDGGVVRCYLYQSTVSGCGESCGNDKRERRFRRR